MAKVKTPVKKPATRRGRGSTTSKEKSKNAKTTGSTRTKTTAKTAPKKTASTSRGSAGNPRAAKPVEYRVGDRKTWYKADSIRAAAEEIGCNAVGLSKRLASMDKGEEYTYTRLEPQVTVRLAEAA